METKVLNRINHQLQYLSGNMNRLVIDADTHATDLDALEGKLLDSYKYNINYYHGRPLSAEELISEMKGAGVDMSLIWQNPAALLYVDDKDKNFISLLKANQYISDSANTYPEQFIPAGWTDPKALGLGNAIRLTEICIREFGFLIVKMNPAQNAYPIDSEDVFKVVRKIVSLGGLPAFHYGADTPFTPAEGIEKIANSFPESKIIAIHMGGGGAGYVEAENLYRESRSLGLRCPNIFFVQSAKRDTHIESDFITYTLAGKPYAHNIACGSDAPYGRIAWNFGGYRAMFDNLINNPEHSDRRVRENRHLFNEEMKIDYMGRNLARLVVEGYEKMRVES